MEKGDPPLPGGGRPKKLPQIDALMALVLGNDDGNPNSGEAKAIMDAMVKQAKKGNVAAAMLLINRGYGMPKQPVELSGPDQTPIQFSGLTLEEKKTALALMNKAKGNVE
jgi:hypothetical protein